ncbi:BAX inhibitor (BI)-1/YccA family protein [Spiribacter sp. C176]|uniref:BAX inhibitor (BI)-1/YccA family protein n=1 Tax=Spiribacter salilacus TaxID=2664894 RepID=A0A6N7QNZ0_9GAMM|nr:Bax inhibitor-1/YccA family protein [Spiribacter salilacus]MRH77752.1 BAX inhibitor (BI)-1/YccA family protein [Spiribacter salilacus]
MDQNTRVAPSARSTSAASSVLSTNKVLRNTYALLSLTLLFSALMAGFAMVTQAPPLNWMVVLVGYFGLLFTTFALRNSAWGILSVFALTGFMGFTLGPILSFYIGAFSNGAELVMMALGGTGVMFLGLSAYALTTQKDFSFLRGFLLAGILVAFVGAIVAIVFSIPALSLAMSAAFVVLMSALILYQTSEIINGGETNYIMATITLYVSIYNLFTSLLHLLAAFSGER